MAVRKSKKILRYSAVSGLLVAIVTSGVWFASYRYYNAKLIDERAAYEQQLADKNEILKRYQDQSRKAFILAAPKSAGEEIIASDIKEEMIPEFASPANLISNKQDIIGKFLKINAGVNTSITAEMVRDDAELDPSERIEETQYVKLPIRAKKTDVVDIRIVFPNGEDYIVIAKKKLEDIEVNNQYAFFNDSEEEAQMLQAALVDAYINNAELYMKRYVEPEMQPRPEPTYLPNLDVLRVIKANPLIVDQAKWKLTDELRKALDKRLEELDPANNIRIGADAPVGSGVSRRKQADEAALSQSNNGQANSQSVDGIVEQTTNPKNNPKVLQPQSDDNQPAASSDMDKTDSQNTESAAEADKQPVDGSSLLGGQ